MNRWLMALIATPIVIASSGAIAAPPPGPAPDRSGSVMSPYNFPRATRGDRFARSGLDWTVGLRGWRRYGGLMKDVAEEAGIDPFVLGAYVWVESEFDPGQDYRNGAKRAVGLSSVQATDYREYSVQALKEPRLNLRLTAREFASRWRPGDMAGTVMDVWYPPWRRRVSRGQSIPVVRSPETYVQAIANRYYALQEIDRHLRR